MIGRRFRETVIRSNQDLRKFDQTVFNYIASSLNTIAIARWAGDFFDCNFDRAPVRERIGIK